MNTQHIVIVNCGMPDTQAEQLHQCLISSAPAYWAVETYENASTFISALRRPEIPFDVVVFSIAERNALSYLIKHRQWFGHFRVVVSISNDLIDALNAIHQLSPRYIGYQNEGFGDLIQVIDQMTKPTTSRLNREYDSKPFDIETCV